MDWVYLHLALNHVAVLGPLFACGLLAWGCWRGTRDNIQLSLWLLVALTVVAIPIKFTGDFAAEGVVSQPAVEKDRIGRHEDSADQATAAVFALGVAAALTLFLSRRGRLFPKWALAVVGIAGLATFVVMARTANLGGHIRHPEIRSIPGAPHGKP
jgi:hypothetical protein